MIPIEDLAITSSMTLMVIVILFTILSGLTLLQTATKTQKDAGDARKDAVKLLLVSFVVMIFATKWFLDATERRERKEKSTMLTNDTIYEGQEIYITYNGYNLAIQEGSGDNLIPEDEEKGFIDYFDLYLSKADDETHNEIGGGMLMQTEYISDKFYGKTVGDIIDYLFANLDGWDSYVTEKPEYEFIEEY